MKSTTTISYAAVGDSIDYSYDVTNSGNVMLVGSLHVNDDKTTVTCPPHYYLDVGETVTCTAVYEVTQDDINAGFVTNIATASAGGTTSNEDSVTVSLGGITEEQMVKRFAPVLMFDGSFKGLPMSAEDYFQNMMNVPGVSPIVGLLFPDEWGWGLKKFYSTICLIFRVAH